MPRRREVPKRKILPESKYGDETLAKFMNNLMLRGKKSVAESIVYDALDLLKAKSNEEDALAVFKKAIENVKPMVEVKSRRVGGSTYQVPVEIRGSRRTALGMRWIITFARKRGERTMSEKLAAELYDASQGRGNSVKKREDTHRMAEANKAFAHYRW
ncbi:MAG: 30S ribosomal protein S7 [Myxococcales bacterium]|nr:30S ribosomal protein S7 [Myxococcales bacterium]